MFNIRNEIWGRSLINLVFSFDIKTRKNECRKLIEKLKRNYHRNIAQEANARLKVNEEKSKRYYEIIIDVLF